MERPQHATSAPYDWISTGLPMPSCGKVRDGLEQGVGDANRLAIMGWGFGGYLAIIGSRRDPSLFRCAPVVVYRCVRTLYAWPTTSIRCVLRWVQTDRRLLLNTRR
jgi:dipeptidyl aminopeptidase/acylaminoacyl peptidase